MKKIVLSLLVLFCLHVFTIRSFAASAELIYEGKNTLPPDTVVSVPILLNTSEKFNAFTLDVSIGNATFEESKNNENLWTAINGPTINDNSLTFTGAALGENKNYSGKKELLILKLKTPAEGVITITPKATIALMDAIATKVETPPLELKLTVSADASTASLKENVIEAISDIKQNSVALYSALATGVVLFLIVIAVIIKKRHSN